MVASMSFTETDIVTTVRSFIERRLLHDCGVELDADASLIELGILDSASFVMVLAFVEEQFAVAVPSQVEIQEVESIAAIARLVQRLGGS
jgi:acyl carrier protein